ncbi:MAG: manganese efflux pump MntP family protein [Actinomycetota bacterium]|nr:manganese efflux pump MntP family protein [Actinomycetota bacterium]
MLRLLALLLPLSLDTFAVAAALAAAGLPSSQRLRVSLVFTGFEAAMPLVGIAAGQAIGRAVGSLADYLAGAALLALGAYLLLAHDDEAGTAARLGRAHGLAVIGLGVSISLDELAIGFSAGLLHLPLAWAIVLIAAQALLAAQLGLRFGARLGEQIRERTEWIAGLALIALGIAFLAVRVV